MRAEKYTTEIEIKLPSSLKLKHILVFNYQFGTIIKIVYHYIGYKNIEKRGIGQWNIKKLKQ